MRLKTLLAAAMTVLVVGCANTDALEQQVSSLTNKIDTLSSQVSDLKKQQAQVSATANEAKMAAKQEASDAAKANDKVNNMVASFKK